MLRSYISIPQPGAVVDAASDGLKKELDTDGNGIIDQNELVNAKANNSDHRLLSANDERVLQLVEGLKAAVDSIPSYVERSSMMWILVPPCKHQDLEGTICDFNSWRDRGWCRMEVCPFCAAIERPSLLFALRHASRQFCGTD